MESKSSAKLHISEKYGLLIALGLIVFFFVMRLFGLLYVVELRVMNIAIMVAGILTAIKTLKRKSPEEFTYFKGMGTGVLTGIIGSILFGLFVFFYVSFVDTDLMLNIVENEPMGRFMNPYIVSVIIVVEGIASALLVSFVTMNYMDPTKLE
ncbi:DUF4199 domain-containing protein [Fulvivirga sp. 29W222]|uniref:DUF4199 domain-containing protein n=1 Tax=Fulvivirga marina TaxID=2494733 RepID=A0A937FZK3_9BACT|nr:DUF4199 domain-containing protein [Fulvivirga marina]MBL6447853.1 DUF4199 domain-containing protein [Fulvivirga marina]